MLSFLVMVWLAIVVTVCGVGGIVNWSRQRRIEREEKRRWEARRRPA